jgi:uncharacterized protein
MPYDLIIGRNEADKKDFGKRGLAYIGKSFVKMGSYNSLSNPIFLDVARTHVVLISGKRGSGKSYTMGSIAESLSDLGREESGNIASLIFDTMGIYWTMKFKNEKDKALLKEWNLKSKNVPVKVFAPLGHFKKLREEGVAIDSGFAIKISELNVGDWLGVFNLGFTEPVGVAIERTITSLKEAEKSYTFEDIFSRLNNSKEIDQNVKNSAIAFFEAARGWGVFDEKGGTTIKELIKSGQTTVIDLSMYASLGTFNVRALVIGLVSKKLFDERMASRKIEEVQSVQHGANWDKYQTAREMPLVWLFIDEAHEFLPHESVSKTPSSDALIQILREGRQPGLSIVLATQQPGKIHTDAITQSDIVLSHRVTAELDVKALNAITQSYLYSSITDKINSLPKLKGSAIILDDNSERIYPMRVRPRFTWHGGEAPMAIKKGEK